MLYSGIKIFYYLDSGATVSDYVSFDRPCTLDDTLLRNWKSAVIEQLSFAVDSDEGLVRVNRACVQSKNVIATNWELERV